MAWKGPVPKLKQWYSEGKDVHIHVCHMIAKVIQENHIKITGDMFTRKPWNEFIKGDEEREQSKRIVHGYNYEMGKKKMALILGVSEEVAGILLKIYGTLFPEIKTNYHRWVESCIRKNATIWMPEPVKFRKIFYDIIDDNLLRSAYSCYPQCTVGSMLNRTIRICANLFRNDEAELLKDQWMAWYGKTNWDKWRILRDRHIHTPETILWSGMDIRLNVHDAGGISIPDNDDLVRWAAKTWRDVAETPIQVHPNETMVIPVDFKKGKTWGAEDLKDYKL